MRTADLEYLSHIPTIKINEVGELLAAGVHHRVYAYGRRQVLKVPRLRYAFLYSERSHLEQDLALLEKYAPGLVVQTDVVSSDDHSHHCILQEKITNFSVLTPATMPSVQQAFKELLTMSAQMRQEQQVALDLLGGEGFYSVFWSRFTRSVTPFCSNVVIRRTKQGKRLCLLDSELLRLGLPTFHPSDCMRWVLSWISWWLTHASLRLFLSGKRSYTY